MRNGQRDFARRRLDKELRFYRLAAKEKNPTEELLRRVRQVVGIPVAEIAGKLGVNRSVILRLEQSEGRGTISMQGLTRVADAMDCMVVYAVIPRDGKTLEEMAERRKWKRLLGIRDEGIGNRE